LGTNAKEQGLQMKPLLCLPFEKSLEGD
jgi:hypothetical protein